jgi:folate-binding protein YgfZ
MTSTTPGTPSATTDTGLAVLRVRGDDAIEFLHGQLSSDVRALAPGEGQYWSYNSPKGRMLANGVLWRAPAGAAEPSITLLLARDLADATRRRLAMFVLRAKATVEESTAASALIGIAGGGSREAVEAAFGVVPHAARAVELRDGAVVFPTPDGRIVVVSGLPAAPMLNAALARHASQSGNEAWRVAGIAAGVATITAATTDLFVPQMVNWDLVGGVSFRKGCYPGQEIVARMQYLGRLKERMFAFHTPALAASPGMRLYSPTFGVDQACGTVVNAAADPMQGSVLLAVAQLSAVEAGDVVLGAPGGPTLQRRPLPYDIPGIAAPAPGVDD